MGHLENLDTLPSLPHTGSDLELAAGLEPAIFRFVAGCLVQLGQASNLLSPGCSMMTRPYH